MTKFNKLMYKMDYGLHTMNGYHPLSPADPKYIDHDFSEAFQNAKEATDQLKYDFIVQKKQLHNLRKKIGLLRSQKKDLTEKVKDLESSLIFSDKAIDGLEGEIRAEYGEKKLKVFKFLRDLMNTDVKL